MPDMPRPAELVRLSSGDVDLLIDPTAGARAVSWRVAGVELLGGKSDNPVEFGMYPMAPWAGRLRDNSVRFGGQHHRMPVTYGPWALHGTVLSQSCSSLTVAEPQDALTAEFTDHDGWPWGMRALVDWRLSGRVLETTIAVESLADAFPVVLGWHPWFRRELGIGSTLEWNLAATQRLVRGDDHLPTGETVRFSREAGPFDDAFVVPDGRAQVRWPGAVTLEIANSAGWFVVYDEPAGLVCVEPQNGPPDGLCDDVRPDYAPEAHVVEPGRPVTLRTRWTVASD